MRFFAPFLLTLFFALFFVLPKQALALYTVTGQVVDGKTGAGIPGSDNSSIYIYSDNTLGGQRTTPDGGGNWQLTVSDGLHSIEIANAGSKGWAPVSSERVTVSTQTNIQFRIVRGYDVLGQVRDQRTGLGIPNVTIYSDFPDRASGTTDGGGNYRLSGLTFGGAGHTIYARLFGDWQFVGSDYQIVNPGAGTNEVRVDFTVQGTGGQIPVTSNANCSLQVYSISGTISPVSVKLSGSFSSNNLSFYYPSRYEWDFNGDGTTDDITYTSATSAISNERTLTVTSITTYQPHLVVYYQNSFSPVSCTSPTTITIYPSQTSNPPTSTALPSCTVTASQTTSNVPFSSTLTGTFYSNNSSYQPNRYRFFAGGGMVQSVPTSQYTYSLPLSFTVPGTYAIRLEIDHAGGTAICYGPTITANQYQTFGRVLEANTTNILNEGAVNGQIYTNSNQYTKNYQKVAGQGVSKIAENESVTSGFGNLLLQEVNPAAQIPTIVEQSPWHIFSGFVSFLQNLFSEVAKADN